MLKKLYLTISSILILQSANASTFGGPGNDHGYHVIMTSDNGIAVLGQIENQSADLYVLKFDSALNLLWSKSIGNPGEYDSPFHICQTIDGGFLIAGGNLNTLKATLVKLNSFGDSLWTQSYGTDPNSIYIATYIDQYKSDELTIGISAGTFTSAPSLYLCRTDSSGNITDTLTIANGGEAVLPVDNGYHITGTIDNLTPAAIGLARLDSITGHSFTKTFYDANLTKELRSNSSAVSGSGFLSAGWTNLYTTNPTEYEFYLLQTDADGDSIWSKHWGNGHSELNEIIRSGNSFYAAGYTEINAVRNNLLMKLNNSGDTVWTKSLGSALSAFSLLENPNGYFIATGDSVDSISGLTDVWLQMFDSLGNFVNNFTTTIIKTVNQDNGITLNPTMATDHIQLEIKEFNSTAIYRASIVDNGGKTVKQLSVNDRISVIDIRNFKPGTYFMRLTDQQEKLIAVKKFIVR